MKVKVTIISILQFLIATAMQAQITIGGNVYGGGNAGDTGGNTNVTIYAGEIKSVFGGARMADVGGRAFVHIDGEKAAAADKNEILIKEVYGGNDIAGTVGKNIAQKGSVPAALTDVLTGTETAAGHPEKSAIDNSWAAYVRTSKMATEDKNHRIIIGKLFGGGNGDYFYRNDGSTHEIYESEQAYNENEDPIASNATGFILPDLTKTYLELKGGCIAHVYGGGNNATTTENTTILINNKSKSMQGVMSPQNEGETLEEYADRLRTEFVTLASAMGLSLNQGDYSSLDFNSTRVFGGNNKAEMKIRPIWHLLDGKIRDLYSGGNEGDMTYKRGLLLEIPAISNITVNNVFGGCRRADVCPMYLAENSEVPSEVPLDDIQLDDRDDNNELIYKFPAGLSARVLVRGGNINNVYGGNDISGSVKGGTAVGVYTSVTGDVYGGGNGSYAYTDNATLGATEAWADYYYKIPEGKTSVEALNAFRPNVEQVSLRLFGTDAEHPTIIGGSVFVGGNSATVLKNEAISNPMIELKIGSNVIADNVFLGNNGEQMVDDSADGILAKYAGTVDGQDFSQMDLANGNIDDFTKYMDGCAMTLMPRVVFDSEANGDPATYDSYSSKFGSFFCGGNVGSMIFDGKTTIDFSHKVIIYNKLVGGCNNANVKESDYNAPYQGGLLGNQDAAGDKLQLNLSGLKIQPMRWNAGHTALEWNTVKYNSDTKEFDPVENVTPTEEGQSIIIDAHDADDGVADAGAAYIARRLQGGNIYGGCYNSGHINGNVVININETLMERDKLFDKTDEGDILYENTEKGKYTITKRNTGVILSEQGMDVLGDALNVFGGGYGGDSEIWGSATINLNKGYVFQIFGGGEMGAIGQVETYDSEGKPEYIYSSANSTYINLNGRADLPGVARGAEGDDPDMAECEFIYGGAFEGVIAGNVHINLNNGRIFNSFAGSCNADILGHTETYVGLNGFPWIRDHIYGGNDLGGSILASETNGPDFNDRIRNEVKGMVAETHPVASYLEYTQGRVRNILGGCFGDYDYEHDLAYKVGTGDDCRVANKPYMHNAFINFRPIENSSNSVEKIFGAGEGFSGDRDGDKGQDHSYVLIDIPDNVSNFATTEVFGAGAYNGLGMRYTAEQTLGDNPIDLNEASAIIDLMRGRIGAAYGGSYEEGVTRRTMVNVPDGSTIKIGSIFGGAYGSDPYKPCDVYEANVNYLTQSENAYLIIDPKGENQLLKGAIYGGNNYARRTLYGKINISAPVRQKHPDYGMTTATVFGAGCGSLTWNEYTEVNLNNGANVWEVYGGGQSGGVMSAESAQTYINLNPDGIDSEIFEAAWTLGSGYDPQPPATLKNGYAANTYTNLTNPLVRPAEMDDRATKTYRYNTNVIIKKGAYVGNYAYGGGLGNENDVFKGSGDVYGTTYIALLGGMVGKDLYAAGTSGSVYNLFGADFTASANAYIMGGKVRNVYGGGWKGSVGCHLKTIEKDGHEVTVEADINESALNDVDGETHVVIGLRPDQSDEDKLAAIQNAAGPSAKLDNYGFYYGVPTIQRNAYGGGEGGAVYGKAHLTINNGYIGYEYKYDETANKWIYEEKIHDETYYENERYAGENRLRDCGNVFGGGYDARSSVDESCVTLWNGMIRGSVHGGGEIATIGRGSTKESGDANSVRIFNEIKRSGKTRVEMFNGHVLRNVYGGGKGYNLLGYGSNSELYTDGYVFGQTEVHIHGGVIGTVTGVKESGYGNVFGGGDLGYVYSIGYKNEKSRKTGTGSPGHMYYYTTYYKCKENYGKYKVNDVIDETTYADIKQLGDEAKWTAQPTALTEDCKVVVSPYLQLKKDAASFSYDGKTYKAYDYVPTDYLNTLPKDKNATQWSNLILQDGDGERGVIIHNAVFGGGNVATNSDAHYANTTTVYGNTTATLNDVYHRDFITVGTEHTGGIYGGGNLSVVDGYREMNITNYGTDYYNMESRVSLEDYHTKLTNRERAYFKLEYQCQENYTSGTISHKQGDRISEADYNVLPDSEKSHWQQYGFCSIYAGRLLNTIQRADFCGVFGSRMVLQGAKDRMADVGEKIDYTINRVGELSLNKQHTLAGDTKPADAVHGNYFGIYSVVNYLGNLTSDVRMKDNYVDASGTQSNEKSFYSYKAAKPQDTWRNKGTSVNEVALASGVFLELTTENSTADHKDYGYITGVVQLELINVKKDIQGGGYVYAKNEHRIPNFYADKENVILSDYNKQQTTAHEAAKTFKRYRYSATYDDGPNKGQSNDSEWTGAGTPYVIEGETAYALKEIQTSGNFIHKTKPIVDDCYPINNAYDRAVNPYSEAHFWYIKGAIYIYDQVVSAYTGSANAYSKSVNLPLTITAASHGKLKLLNVKPNRYAYYSAPNEKIGTGSSAADSTVWVNHQADGYKLNEAITWWDWQNLPLSEQAYFVENTYVNAEVCVIGDKKYAVGEYVMLPDEYNAMKNPENTPAITDAAGRKFEDENGAELTGSALVEHVFRSSNNISHDTGYVLTFDMDTPSIWDDYYTKKTDNETIDNEKITKAAYKSLTDEQKKDYLEAPTYSPTEDQVLGKRHYTVGQVVTQADYNFAVESGDGADKMEPAYVATTDVSYTYNDVTKTIVKGTAIGYTEWYSLASEKKSAFALAWVCTNTVDLGNDNYLLNGDLVTDDEITAMKAITPEVASDEEINAALSKAYICKVEGDYGGRKYLAANNYTALESWNNLSATDRAYFNYNYDALDLLVDKTYSVDPEANEEAGNSTTSIYHAPYSNTVGVEYMAMFKGYSEDSSKPYTYDGGTVAKGASISNEVFEAKVPNYKRFYTKVTEGEIFTETGSSKKYFYLTTQDFIYDGQPYGIGQVVNEDVFTHNEGKVEKVETSSTAPFYYCYEDHTEEDHTEGGTPVVTSVEKGHVITEAAYKDLTDDSKYFVIQGTEPTETTTFYVSRESNIKDVTKEKIITVVYQYTYYEQDDDDSGTDEGGFRMTSELHVVNIHLQLESGVPTIGILENPPMVLPGESVGLKNPTVSPGTYEVLTNGYELFANESDAQNHRNGMPFTNNQTPVYWYQNGDHYIAFYSKTWLGKTYSNYVPLSVANYHDIADIMENHKDNHLYIDRADVDRPCKIYINDYTTLPESDARKDKNGLDELKNLFTLSTGAELTGHEALGQHIKNCTALEFFLRSDIDHRSPAWTSIAAGTGENDPCFSGTLHGDGHTISGLSQSLFGKLCGAVYNLGVTGSFNTAGIADTGSGYVESCWVKTDADTPLGEKPFAVFGNPSAPKKDGKDWTQVVNCYYPESNNSLYSTDTNVHGNARMMPDKAFYNGEVAYDLNGFYLYRRYHDGVNTDTGDKYYNYKLNADGTLPMKTNEDGSQTPVREEVYYPAKPATPTPSDDYVGDMGYVEGRFADGDFIYAGGEIPTSVNERYYADDKNEIYAYYPIWPDDYLFFGQRLNYGYDTKGQPHQNLPSVIQKNANDRVITSETGNRVYRAPAYFRSSEMKVAHFNPYAVFAQHKNGDPNTIAYQNMTAIDFTGYNDANYSYQLGWNQWSKTSQKAQSDEDGKSSSAYAFYPPLLDDGGLAEFTNIDLTQNLLVYTKDATDNEKTYTAVTTSECLLDLDYSETGGTYRTVEAQIPNRVKGHAVVRSKSGTGASTTYAYTTEKDHFLVDKNDFNAPISYKFKDGKDGKRMWYQRTPDDDEFVDRKKGWSAISLPFTAELVTTNQKGEITHFYDGSPVSKNNTNTKIGHEYWLRMYCGIDDAVEVAPSYKMATMNYPNYYSEGVLKGYPTRIKEAILSNDENDKEINVMNKLVTNKFLWDYYYSKDPAVSEGAGQDANTDIYRLYYNQDRDYSNYKMLTRGTPYIIGFPGATYYEFDLSGDFEPKHTYKSIDRLDNQTITFASPKGSTIHVSDEEKDGVTCGGYTFYPSYLNEKFKAGTDYYTLYSNYDGNSSAYKKVPASGDPTPQAAFRPFFFKEGGVAGARGATRGDDAVAQYIIFDDDDSEIKKDEPIQEEEKLEGLIVNGGRKVVVVKSNLREEKEINIVNMAGVTLAAFTIQPGETITTNVALTGVYIVRTTDGRYTKKVLVR